MFRDTNRATLTNGREIYYYDAELVRARLEEAADTMRRLKVSWTRPPKLRAVWPDVVHEYWEAFGVGEPDVKISPPSPKAISRLDETLNWILLIDDPRLRRVVWAKAHKIGMKRIGQKFGVSRESVRRWYNQAIDEIVVALNRELSAR